MAFWRVGKFLRCHRAKGDIVLFRTAGKANFRQLFNIRPNVDYYRFGRATKKCAARWHQPRNPGASDADRVGSPKARVGASPQSSERRMPAAGKEKSRPLAFGRQMTFLRGLFLNLRPAGESIPKHIPQ